ncbi:MAG: glycosyltransferase [Chloroflexi bacterium]|nr:glycosyltransferase [Chloroflexota bacterium]
MLRNELIVCFSTVSWDFLWQRHHEVMTRFARAGNRVLFVDPIGVRMVQWRDAHRIVARLQNRRRAGKRGIRQVIPNVWVMDPLVNPLQEIEFVHRRNVTALTRQVQNAIAQLGGGKPILWTYAPTRLAYDVIARLAHKLVVYECVDAMTANPKGVLRSLAASEEKLSRGADVVLVTSRALLERHLPLNPSTYYVPHGVEYDLFADDTAPEPATLAAIPHPRLAFFGSIDERVDFELLARLAQQHPAWHIVLLGLARVSIAALQKFPNIHFLGLVAHKQVPAYLHAMDVLLMPYLPIEFSQYLNPLKLQECFAVGKPTVVYALPAFEEYRSVLRIAATADEYEALVQDALREPKNAPQIEQRRACACANTWDARFAEINARVQAHLL